LIAGKSCNDKRCQHGGGAGDGANLDSLRDRFAHQLESRIGNEWRSRIADQSDALPFSQPREKFRARLRGIVIVVGDERPRETVNCEQLCGNARIFSGNGVARGKNIERSQRDITRIADRRGNDIEARRENLPVVAHG